MKRFPLLFSSVCVLFLVSQGCSSDYIDEHPTEQVTIEDLDAYNDNEGAESFVNSIYSKYLDWNLSSFSWIGVTSIISDNADKGSDPGDSGTDKDKMDALTFSATTPSFNEQWNSNYQALNRANQALDILPQLDSVDTDLKERLIGESKFLRALTYFQLVRMFGGVPIVDHVPEAGNEKDEGMTMTRKSEDEVYDFIEDDLDDAQDALPDKGEYGSNDAGRASIGAAYALHAKVALYRENWEDAVDFANEVEGYSLADNYADNFRPDGELNNESIFEIQSRGGEGEPAISQYSQVQGARGNGGTGGWGFNTPSQNLVDAFDSEGDDIRKEATIIFRPDTLFDGRIIAETVDNPRYNYKSYSTEHSGEANADANINILRYAEVLLIKAEALNELGKTGEAVDLVNQIRNRVDLPNTGVSDQDEVRQAIWKERRLELAMEHDRWFDLIRTGQAKEKMAEDGKDFEEGKHELFPIPNEFLKEVEENGRSMDQNPGY